MLKIVKLQESQGQYHLTVPAVLTTWKKWEKGHKFVVEEGKDGIMYRDLAAVAREEKKKKKKEKEILRNEK
jgi:hypothetical protein